MDSESEAGEQRASARVVVVDDDPLSTSIQAHLLSLLGHRASVETDAGQAVERALAGEFDLILLDLGMPGLSGFEALRRLRQREAAMQRPPIPVIAVTGYTSEADRVRCLMAGFADHVSKPIHADKYEIALRRALSAGPPVAPASEQSDAERLRATIRRLQEAPAAERGFGPTVAESVALRSQQLIESMKMALTENDAEQLVCGARAMRSAAEFLGVHQLAAMCAQLDSLLMQQQWGAVETILHEIEHWNQAVLTMLFESAR